MTAEKIVKINSDYELSALNEKLNIYESVINYAVAEQMLSLKNKVKDLEDEAIALRAADTEKEKLIAEKDKRIAEIKKNFTTQLESKLQWERKQFEAELEEKLKHKENNMNYTHIKPLEKQVEQANNERDRVQTMYKSLLDEFNQSHNNETAILNMCSEILTTVKQLVNNGATPEEVIEKIDSSVESLKSLSIKEECDIIHSWLMGGHSKKEIAAYLYPDLARREQKVQERINSKTYKDMFGHI